MSSFLFLIPISLFLGLGALAAFMWSLRSGQYEDLDGAAERVLLNEDRPIPDPVDTTRRSIAAAADQYRRPGSGDRSTGGSGLHGSSV